MSKIGEIAPLIIIVAVLTLGFIKNIELFSLFQKGAKSGLSTVVRLLPTLIGIIIAISMLSASGALDCFKNIIKPLADQIGFPSELLPLAILKPISGSGATGIVTNIFEQYGPDSEIGQIASVMMASTEATIYAITIYFSTKNYKRLRYVVPVALLGDIITIALSVLTIRIFS